MEAVQKEQYAESDYYNLPENIRAEVINGQIYYQPAPSRIHQRVLSEMHTAVNNYIKTKGGACQVYPAPFAVRLDEDRKNVVEPDISVICDPGKLTERGCSGAPDWIIEIVSPSNISHDYIRKLNLYADAGVREYWIVNPADQTVLAYSLEEKQFHVSSYDFKDKIKVTIYEDFWIDFAELSL